MRVRVRVRERDKHIPSTKVFSLLDPSPPSPFFKFSFARRLAAFPNTYVSLQQKTEFLALFDL